MANVRKAAVAGSFYPADKKELQEMVEKLLNDNDSDIKSTPKAVIAPHAGLVFSGGVAASAYAPLKQIANDIDHIVLLGPSHKVPLKGVGTSTADKFNTPLGDVKLNKKAISYLVKEFDHVDHNDPAHEKEHSLEVHLPFLQNVFPKFTLTPLVVGDSTPEEVNKIIARFWDDKKCLIVISTDLSHYKDYDTASKLDLSTTYNIEDLKYDSLDGKTACGSRPVKGLLHYAKENDLTVKSVDFCNSGDTAGPKDRVVGYASFYCGQKDEIGNLFSKPQKKLLLKLAYLSIDYHLKNGKKPTSGRFVPRFDTENPVATFVTLKKNGKLRGCIGSLRAHRPVLRDVIHNACAAAFNDPRFPKVTAEELRQLDISLSVLSAPAPLEFSSEKDLIKKIRPSIDGLILSDGQGKSGTFLPTVWESYKEPEEFLRHLKRKAGLDMDFWSDDVKILRYTTEVIDRKII